jgi:hypothetical protein
MTARGARVLPTEPAVIKACCAAGYQSDLVGLVLGESYHPGGTTLTRRLAEAVGLSPGQDVLDVASGPGSTAFLLAREYGVSAVGVDLGEASVDAANARARQSGVQGTGAGRVRFIAGDAERLPLPDASVDVVVSECALCTFPDKTAAAAEMARVLRPGGRVGITDVVVQPDRLDPELADLAGWVACLADAQPVEGYRNLLSAAGFDSLTSERHDEALMDMIDRIDARIRALAMAGAPALAEVDLAGVRRRINAARRAVGDGTAGYALLMATRS